MSCTVSFREGKVVKQVGCYLFVIIKNNKQVSFCGTYMIHLVMNNNNTNNNCIILLLEY
jgi:hypothetical protein